MRRSPEWYDTLEPLAELPEYCDVTMPETEDFKPQVCGREILTMAYKGTGACGEEHLKIKTADYGTKQVSVNPTGEC